MRKLLLISLLLAAATSCTDTEEDNNSSNNSNNANNTNNDNNANMRPACPTLSTPAVRWAPAAGSTAILVDMLVPEEVTPFERGTGPTSADFRLSFLNERASRNPERELRLLTTHTYNANMPWAPPADMIPPATDANRDGATATELGQLELDGQRYQIRRLPTTGDNLILLLSLNKDGNTYGVEIRVHVAKVLGGAPDADYAHCIDDYERIGLAVAQSLRFLP